MAPCPFRSSTPSTTRKLDDVDYTPPSVGTSLACWVVSPATDRIQVGNDAFEIIEMDGRRVKTVRYHAGADAPAPSP